MKILLKILLLVALGVAAFEGYIWYKVRAVVAEQVKAVSPFVNVYYGEVVSSIFPREMGINDLQINFQGQVINVQSVRLKPDSIWDLYAIEQDPAELFKRGLAVELTGLDVTDYYSQSISAQLEHEGFLGDSGAQPCSPMPRIGISDLRQMGYEELLIDGEFRIRPPSGSGPGGFSVSGRMQDMLEFNLDFDFLLELNDPMMLMMQLENVDFHALAYSQRDLGFSQKWIDFCAKERGYDADLFVQAHLLELQDKVARDLELGLKSSLLDAYRSYLLDGSRIRVRLQPQTSQWMEQLTFYPKEEYAQLLGLEVLVDGRKLTDVGFIEAPPLVDARGRTAVQRLLEERGILSPVADDVDADDEAAEQLLSWEDLAAYSGTVVITTGDDREHRGRVKDWSKRRLMLLKWVGGGRFTFPIQAQDFKSAKPAPSKR